MEHEKSVVGRVGELLRILHETERELEQLTGAAVPARPCRDCHLTSVVSRQRAHLNALPAQVCLLDPAGKIIAVNEAWMRFAGENDLRDPSGLVGQNYLEVCDRAVGPSASQGKDVAAGIRAVLSGAQREYSHDYPCHSPFQERWFRVRVTPAEDSAGVVVMHIDITHETRIEHSLVESEARLRAVFDLEPEGVDILSLDGVWVETNAAGMALFEASTRADLLGKPFEQFVHADDRAAYKKALEKVVRGESTALQVRIVGLRGRQRWLDMHAGPLRGAGGAITSVLNITRDITEQRRAIETLHERESLLSTALKLAQMGAWVLDIPTNQILWSYPTYDLFGVTSATFDGTQESFMKLVVEDDRPSLAAAYQRAESATDEGFEIVYRIRRPDGSIRRIFERGQLERDEHGAVRRRLGVAMDITEPHPHGSASNEAH